MSRPQAYKVTGPNLSAQQIATQPVILTLDPESTPQAKTLKHIPENNRLRSILRIKNSLAPDHCSPCADQFRRWSSECGICSESRDIRPDIYLSDCQHRGDYCQECLDEYAIYRIKQFQEVPCPHPACDRPIDTSGSFFRQLPNEVQARYRKIQQFYVTHQDDNLKLCPAEECEGVIRLRSSERVMVCDSCQKRFCSDCLFIQHSGQCDTFQINFLQLNLSYRKCICGVVIQKNQGCNRITCICGHEFCYSCGEPWTRHHEKHDQHGNPVLPQQAPSPKRPPKKTPTAPCQECLATFLTTLLRIVLFPLKLICLLLLFLLLFLFMVTTLAIGLSLCLCMICAKDCRDLYLKILSLGSDLKALIGKLWDL